MRSVRYLEASGTGQQDSILDALPAHVALLDSQGIITSVNKAWREFGDSNGLHSPGHALGINYLAVCDGARGLDAPVARQVAAGIRAVLERSTDSFSLEYSCHAPKEQRWFVMTASPVEPTGRNGAVVMHINVTTERLAEANLRVSEARFREMTQTIQDVVFLRDAASAQVMYVSPAYEEIWGRSCESLYADPDSWAEAIHPDDRTPAYTAYILGSKEPSAFEYRIVRPNGSIRWIQSRRFPVIGDSGEIVRITGIARDVTEQKLAEIRIRHLNRVYAVLSGINSLIVRVADLEELFKEACRVAVEAGGFRMSLIATLDRSTGLVVPAASAGKDGRIMQDITAILSSATHASNSMVMLAIRERKAVVSNDSRNDARVLLGTAYAEAGVRSLAVLPLLVADEPVGVLVLYADEMEFFHAQEMKLLTELAGDIAFAIDHIGKGERLNYLAFYDSLTGLANQSLFLQRLEEKVLSPQDEHSKKAVFVLDIERFKSINDAFGRKTGDELLRQVAECLVLHGGGDASRFARIGADRFAIVASGMDSVEQVARYVEQRLDATFRAPFLVGDHDLRVFVKVGIALFPNDGADADTLLRHAEAALKKAKTAGERYLFFTQKMTERVAERISLENRLRHALDNDEFVLHYQPKVNLVSGLLTSAEALIRWNDPRTGLVPPLQFIPILEETGLIHEVGRWALREAIEVYLRWRNAGLAAVRIAVNVSPLQLRNRGFIAEIEQALGIDTRASTGLELEITESLIMENVTHSIASLQTIRAMGVTIAIDDFGTGFSSLSYLTKLPVDTLKIDRSFITDMTGAPEGLSLVSTIIDLSHALKLKVVAEGVETEEQSRLLRLLRCDEMQGYLFSKPVPADVFEAKFLVPATVVA